MTFVNSLTFPWDISILILLSGAFGVAFAGWRWLRNSAQKRLLTRLGVIFVSLVFTIFFLILSYGSFIEPQLLTVTRADIPFPIQTSLKIAVISDLHVGPYKGEGYIRRVVARINREMPDIVLIGGDLVFTNNVTPDILTALAPLKDLRPALGTFAIMGNHDHGIYRLFSPGQYRPADRSDLIAETLKGLGIIVLENTQSRVRIGDDVLIIAGVEDALSGQADIVSTLQGAGKLPVILLSHNPDIILDPLSRLATLIVAGHTHGGQIRLPWYGALAALPTHIGRKYDQGIFHLKDDGILAITRGVGESGPRVRFFAPPEILLLTTVPVRSSI